MLVPCGINTEQGLREWPVQHIRQGKHEDDCNEQQRRRRIAECQTKARHGREGAWPGGVGKHGVMRHLTECVGDIGCDEDGDDCAGGKSGFARHGPPEQEAEHRQDTEEQDQERLAPQAPVECRSEEGRRQRRNRARPF